MAGYKLGRRRQHAAERVDQLRPCFIVRARFGSDGISNEANEHVHRRFGASAHRFVMLPSQGEKLAKRQTRCQELEAGSHHCFVGGRVDALTIDGPRCKKTLTFDRFQKSRRDTGAFRELGQRERAGLGTSFGESKNKSFIGGIEITGQQTADRGLAEALLLEGPDPLQTLEVLFVVPSYAALALRLWKEALRLIEPDRVHADAGSRSELIDPIPHE